MPELGLFESMAYTGLFMAGRTDTWSFLYYNIAQNIGERGYLDMTVINIIQQERFDVEDRQMPPTLSTI